MGKKFLVNEEVLISINNTINNIVEKLDSYKSIITGNVNFHNQLQKTFQKDVQDIQTFRQSINALQEYKEPAKPVEPAKQVEKPVDLKKVVKTKNKK